MKVWQLVSTPNASSTSPWTTPGHPSNNELHLYYRIGTLAIAIAPPTKPPYGCLFALRTCLALSTLEAL
jgi:hypothetical protein